VGIAEHRRDKIRSFLRKRESKETWVPACAGTNGLNRIVSCMPQIVQKLEDLIAPIGDGCVLAVPRGKSGGGMAGTRWRGRDGVKDVKVRARRTASLEADLLIGAGCVVSIETSAVSLGEFGPAPRFTAAVTGGKIAMKDATCPALHAAFQAAEKGIPFMPLR